MKKSVSTTLSKRSATPLQLESKRTLDIVAEKRIQVCLRVRPPSQLEIERNYKQSIFVDESSNMVIALVKPRQAAFVFDHVAVNDTQMDVFEKVGRPICDKCLEGFNGTIFAYGQTGSGKTHTMMGPAQELFDTASSTIPTTDTRQDESRGLIPRVFDYIFTKIHSLEESSQNKIKFSCKASIIEIYNDRIYDLLVPNSETLQIREHTDLGVYLDRQKEVEIKTVEDAFGVIERGALNRTVGCTEMNRESSRSHCILTLVVQSTEAREGTEAITRISRLNLIDLAGSERQTKAGTIGARLSEASAINQSLSTLGNVIDSLVDISYGRQRHIPYRDSKLTFLLKDSLGGNSLTYFVVCVSPAFDSLNETLSSLKFAQRVKKVKNRTALVDYIALTPEDLRRENLRLQRIIEKLTKGLPRMHRRSSSTSAVTEDFDCQSEAGRSAVYDTLSRDTLKGAVSTFQEDMLMQALKREQEYREYFEQSQYDLKMVTELNQKSKRQHDADEKLLKSRQELVQNLQQQVDAFKSSSSWSPSQAEAVLQSKIDSLETELRETYASATNNPDVLARAIETSKLERKVKELTTALTHAEFKLATVMEQKTGDGQNDVFVAPSVIQKKLDEIQTFNFQLTKQLALLTRERGRVGVSDEAQEEVIEIIESERAIVTKKLEETQKQLQEERDLNKVLRQKLSSLSEEDMAEENPAENDDVISIADTTVTEASPTGATTARGAARQKLRLLEQQLQEYKLCNQQYKSVVEEAVDRETKSSFEVKEIQAKLQHAHEDLEAAHRKQEELTGAVKYQSKIIRRQQEDIERLINTYILISDKLGISENTQSGNAPASTASSSTPLMRTIPERTKIAE